jgi:prophage regulatory protein
MERDVEAVSINSKTAVRKYLYATLLRPLNHSCGPIFSFQCCSIQPPDFPVEGDQTMPEPDRIIRLATVLHRTGLSRSTFYRKIQEGTFPRQFPISTNGCGWHESTINQWIAKPAGWRAPDER